jgi:hypothetical protein
MMIADFAQAINGKLYIMGGGWSIIGPAPTPFAIAIKIEVPWSEANKRHNLKLELLDSESQPVLVPTPAGNSPLVITAHFKIGRPAGIIQGAPLDVPFAFNIAPFALSPGKRYIWKLTINENPQESWQVTFSTRRAGQKPGEA